MHALIRGTRRLDKASRGATLGMVAPAANPQGPPCGPIAPPCDPVCAGMRPVVRSRSHAQGVEHHGALSVRAGLRRGSGPAHGRPRPRQPLMRTPRCALRTPARPRSLRSRTSSGRPVRYLQARPCAGRGGGPRRCPDGHRRHRRSAAAGLGRSFASRHAAPAVLLRTARLILAFVGFQSRARRRSRPGLFTIVPFIIGDFS